MHDKANSGLQVVKKEEKESRVTAFVEQHLEKIGCSGLQSEFLLVARSPESPVCRALSALAPKLAAHNITVQVVFTAIDTGAFHSESQASEALLKAATCRVVSDVRLYEAHEQLVLDDTTCWIGDCMRREPAKRDAYESYSNSCAQTAGAAAVSFSHLWRAGTCALPFTRTATPFGFKDSPEAEVIASNIAGEENVPPTALTRH
ncbi:MAG: hypothetical protein K0U74_16860 [Alphaproteobacteria bacterium]|nr:hypothetical protein [Alphaproteobacteria bacterium]